MNRKSSNRKLSFPSSTSKNDIASLNCNSNKLVNCNPNQVVMETKNGKKPLWLSLLRWTARVIAIIFILFILSMFIGEGGFWSHPKGALPLCTKDYVFLSLFGLYVVALAIGLWREGLGGILSLSLMIVFIIGQIIILWPEGIKRLIYFYLMLLPCILYFLSWFFHRRFARKEPI